MEIIIKETGELTSLEFIDIAKARVKVFVVEQNCPYQEIDDLDSDCLHILFKDRDNLQAYARVIEYQDYVVIGRVLVVEQYRGQKRGNDLLTRVLDEVKEKYPDQGVHISAQSHLIDFYGAFGFKAVSEVYLEDDIPHIDMVLENI